MPSGGARVRSGPAPDPRSGRSERRHYDLAALPNSGYTGKPPRYPLADYRIVTDDGEDAAAEKAWKERERSVWKMLWKTPQACAWSLPENAYLSWDVALYCRQLVLCEQSGASASDRALLPRFADRIGLSAAGLAALGWRIVPDEVGAARMAKQAEEPAEQPEPARRERTAW